MTSKSNEFYLNLERVWTVLKQLQLKLNKVINISSAECTYQSLTLNLILSHIDGNWNLRT